jgi:hypothetical protein
MQTWQSVMSCWTMGRHRVHMCPHVARQQSRCGSRWLMADDGPVVTVVVEEEDDNDDVDDDDG